MDYLLIQLDSDFAQQRLPAWQPILTPHNVIPSLFIIAIIFVPIGILFIYFSSLVQEYSFDYTQCLEKATENFEKAPDHYGSVPFEWRRVKGKESIKWALDSEIGFDGITDTSASEKGYCEIRFSITKDISGPVFLYYRLKNFYQNQRLYVRSVDERQLRGEARTYKELRSSCDPLIGPSDQNTIVYYPCGLIANSMFTDVISGLRSEPTPSDRDSKKIYEFRATEISVKAQRRKYRPSSYSNLKEVKAPPSWVGNVRGVRPDGYYVKLPDFSEDERFQNWMSVAGLPVFRKTYGRHDGKIVAGTYNLVILSQYDVTSYGATKSVVISNTSWIGGKNPFLGYAYIVVGLCFLIIGIAFLIQHLVAPRRLGDSEYLSWNRQNRNVSY